MWLELLRSRTKLGIGFKANFGFVETHCFFFQRWSNTNREFQEEPDNELTTITKAATAPTPIA